MAQFNIVVLLLSLPSETRHSIPVTSVQEKKLLRIFLKLSAAESQFCPAMGNGLSLFATRRTIEEWNCSFLSLNLYDEQPPERSILGCLRSGGHL